jgi:hypothetical protein
MQPIPSLQIKSKKEVDHLLGVQFSRILRQAHDGDIRLNLAIITAHDGGWGECKALTWLRTAINAFRSHSSRKRGPIHD